MCPIKCYWMLQNVRVTAFPVSEFSGKTNRGWLKLPPHHRLGLIIGDSGSVKTSA